MEDREFQRELFFVSARDGDRKSIDMVFYPSDEEGIRAARQLWLAEPTADIQIKGRQKLGTHWLRVDDFKDNAEEMFFQALELSRHNDVIICARDAPPPLAAQRSPHKPISKKRLIAAFIATAIIFFALGAMMFRRQENAPTVRPLQKGNSAASSGPDSARQ